jgi:sugar phosphate isomerase/epimerase
MPVAVLTAAVQEPNMTRDDFRKNPIRAAMRAATTWIRTGKEIQLDGIQLACALSVPDAYLPPEQMLDPVAPHGALRTKPDGTGEDLSDENAETLIRECGPSFKIYSLGFFENLLHPDPAIRKQIHEHLLRCGRAAQKLKPVGCRGVTTFIGRDTNLSIEENLVLYRQQVVPLLKAFKKMGLKLYLEPCPMPGWGPADTFVHNLAYCPTMWITLERIARKYKAGNVLRITYDASHDILMGTTPYASFRFMQAAGFGYMLEDAHGKDQNVNPAKRAAHNVLGQRVGLGIRDTNGELTDDPAKLKGAWGRMTAAHSLPGIGQYNTYAQDRGLKVDWFAHQLHFRSVLGVNPVQSDFIIEHEWNPARDQNMDRVVQAIAISSQFVRSIDAGADANFRAEQWCIQNRLPWPKFENPLEVIEGLEAEVASVLAIVV